MALVVKFYNANDTLNNSVTAKSVTINEDGSCTIIADRTATWATGDGSQVLRYPAINNLVEIVKAKVT